MVQSTGVWAVAGNTLHVLMKTLTSTSTSVGTFTTLLANPC